MPLTVGTRLGSHEIIALLGKGGMGEVYRARDLKLKREVAIKILPEEFSRDADRVSRFQREAEVLASLNHPNIAGIHELAEGNGSRFLVLELVEGETLADRIARGPISVEETFAIAKQICEALEAAHEKGIIHRDLKPANVKLTPDGKVKVLDFGLAKALAKNAPDVSMSQSPTLSLSATNAGALIGTAAYIPPEQVKGFTSDQRGDIFAFGCVLYEMLTGKQTFDGDTIAEILASVLKSEPKLDLLPKNLSPRMKDLLRRCLEKNPKRRWYAIGDVRVELEAAAVGPIEAQRAAPAGAPKPAWTWAVAALGLGLIAGAGLMAFVALRPLPAARPAITRFVYTLPEGQTFPGGALTHIAISPDGTQIAYQTSSGLYVRSMGDFQPRPIRGSDVNGAFPTFSPDGKFIAFYSATERALKKVALSGGPPQTLCLVSGRPNGVMDWSDTGILFAQDTRIMRVSSNGGQAEVVISTKPEEAVINLGSPQLLPGGDAVLFTLQPRDVSDGDKFQTVVQSLKSGQPRVVIQASDARYVPTGYLAYVSGGTLVAVPFDVKRLAVTGSAVPIVEGVRKPAYTTEFGFSKDGTLIYVPGPVRPGSQGGLTLAFLDREGRVEPLKMPAGSYNYPRISPNGKQAAFVSDDGKGAGVWIYDLSGASSPRKLTLVGSNRYPAWSGDSQRLAFQSDREGDLGIWQQRADGSDAAERLTKPDMGTEHIPDSWSLDGQWLSFTSIRDSHQDLWVYSIRDKKASPFAQAPMQETGRSAFSPDGKWLAYQRRDNNNAMVIIVQPFPANVSQYQISDCGSALDPLWSRDGKELFCQPRGGIVSVSVNTHPAFTFGNARTIEGRDYSRLGPENPRNWDIMPDGKQFIVVARGDQPETASAHQINIVLNWFEDLKQKMSSK